MAVHIDAILRIRRIDLCGDGDATCRYHCCSNFCLSEVTEIGQCSLKLQQNISGVVFSRATLCYIARVLAMALCLCLSVSRVGVLAKGMNGLICFLAWRLLSTSPTLSFKEILVSTKIRVLPFGTFS